MPAHARTSDEAVVKAYLATRSLSAAGAACGVSKTSVRKRISKLCEPGKQTPLRYRLLSLERWAAECGLLGTDPVMPGFVIKEVSRQTGPDGELQKEWVRQGKAPGGRATVPAGHVVKGVSTLVDAEGRKVAEWIKTREGRTPTDAVREICEALASLALRAPVSTPPAATEADLATVYVAADWHVGLLTWGQETGTDWDLTIAQRAIRETAARLVAGSPASRQAVVLGLGDLLHADGLDNCTPASKHVLDVDGRYPKVLRAATMLMVELIDLALAKHESVLVRILSGNHDPESSIAVALALGLYYSRDQRVTVDDSPSPFWWWRWGSTLLGATHGDGAKMKDLPLVMATSVPEAWGQTKHRAIYTGHIHTQTGQEHAGVTVESFQAPVPPDAWHRRKGYGAGRSLVSITHHKADGEIARTRATIRPLVEEPVAA